MSSKQLINFDKIGKDLQFQILTNQNKSIQNYISGILKSESLIEEEENSKLRQTIGKLNSEQTYNDESNDPLQSSSRQTTRKRPTISFKKLLDAGGTSKNVSGGLRTSAFTRKSINNLNSVTGRKVQFTEKRHMSLKDSSSNVTSLLEANSLLHEVVEKDAASSANSESNYGLEYKKSKTIFPPAMSLSSASNGFNKSKTINLNPKYITPETKNSANNIAFDWRRSTLINEENRIKLKNMAIELRKSLQINNHTSSEEDDDEKTISKSFYPLLTIHTSPTKEEIVPKEKCRKLLRTKLVYDSCSDDEIEDDDSGVWMLEPNSIAVKVIECLVLIALLYSTLITPIQLAFKLFGSITYIVLEGIVDLIFISDFVSGFYIGHHDFDEKLIKNRWKIFIYYFYSWFTFDLLTAIPVNSFFAILLKLANFEISLTVEITELIILIRLLKFFKFFLKHDNHFNLMKLFKISANMTFIFSFTLYFTINHLLACVFIFLSKLEVGGWVDIYGFTDSEPFDVYVASFYFNSATIFTIGYGDIICVNIYERSYNVLLLMVGILIYSYAVSVLSRYVQNQDEKTAKFGKRLEILQQFKLKYEIKDEIYLKIARFLRYEYMIYKIDNNTLLSELPVRLRNELMYNMYQDVIQNFVFFKSFDNLDFINRVLLTLKPIKALRNEIIMREGELVDETVFVKMGVLSLEVSINLSEFEDKKPHLKDSILKKIDKNETVIGAKGVFKRDSLNSVQDYKPPDIRIFKIIKIRRNEHFGDVLMFLNQPSPLSVRVKSKIAELLLLNKINLANIAKDYPEIFHKIYLKSIYNMDKIQLIIESAKQILVNEQRKQKAAMRRDNNHNLTSTQEVESLNLIEEPQDDDNDNTEMQGKKVKKSYRSAKSGMVIHIDNESDSVNSSQCGSNVIDRIEEEKRHSERDELKVYNSSIDYLSPSHEKRINIMSALIETDNQSINDENIGDIILNYDQVKGKHISLEGSLKKKPAINVTQIHNIINNGNINIITGRDYKNTKRSKKDSTNFVPLIDHTISFTIEQCDRPLTMPFKFRSKKSNYNVRAHMRKRTVLKKGSILSSSSGGSFNVSIGEEKKRAKLRRRSVTMKPKNNKPVDLFESKPSFDMSVRKDLSDKSISSFNSDESKQHVTRRRHKMFSVIQKNIVNSNMNLENPESYYKKLLFDYKNENDGKVRNNFTQKQNEKVLDRLGKLEGLFKNKAE
jgi:hypothetical protein